MAKQEYMYLTDIYILMLELRLIKEWQGLKTLPYLCKVSMQLHDITNDKFYMETNHAPWQVIKIPRTSANG